MSARRAPEPSPVRFLTHAAARGQRLPSTNVLLGRLDIQEVLPGAANAGPAVRKAFEQLATGLNTTAEGAARTLRSEFIDLNMAAAIRKITLERGLDTRKFVLIPFGGASVHACSIAENLRIPRVLVPNWPGVTSALGCVLADIRYDDTWTVHQQLSQIEPSRVKALYQMMVERVMTVMREDGVADEKVALRYEAALQYEGQTHRVTITLPSPNITVEDLGNAYMKEYRERYGVTVNSVPIRLVNLRVRASAPRDRYHGRCQSNARFQHERRQQRAMFFAGAWHEASIHQRTSLRAGAVIKGPARISQSDSTTIVAPCWIAQVDGRGNIAITHEAFKQ